MSTTKDQMTAFRQAEYEVNEVLADRCGKRGDWWQILIATRGAARVARQLAAFDTVPVERLEAAIYWMTYFVSRHARGRHGPKGVDLRDAIMPILMQHLPQAYLDTATLLVRTALLDASLRQNKTTKVHYGPLPCRPRSRHIVLTDDPALVTCGNCKQRMEAQKS